MEMTNEKESRHEALELVLARLLRVGSMLAAGLMVVGIGLMLAGLPLGTTLVMAGLLTLVSTPVLRVVAAMVVFMRERDYLFALFCLVVVLSLGVGMAIGHTE